MASAQRFLLELLIFKELIQYHEPELILTEATGSIFPDSTSPSEEGRSHYLTPEGAQKGEVTKENEQFLNGFWESPPTLCDILLRHVRRQ